MARSGARWRAAASGRGIAGCRRRRMAEAGFIARARRCRGGGGALYADAPRDPTVDAAALTFAAQPRGALSACRHARAGLRAAVGADDGVGEMRCCAASAAGSAARHCASGLVVRGLDPRLGALVCRRRSPGSPSRRTSGPYTPPLSRYQTTDAVKRFRERRVEIDATVALRGDATTRSAPHRRQCPLIHDQTSPDQPLLPTLRRFLPYLWPAGAAEAARADRRWR